MTVIATRITAKGGWIDVSFDGAAIIMAAVGPPLRVLVDEPKNLRAQQQRAEERGRYRRMALDSLERAGASTEIFDAEIVWSHRAG